MQTEKQTRLYSCLLGFSAISLQIILIREMFVVFYGNELSFGFFLGVWMIWFAIGSWLGHFIPVRLAISAVLQLAFIGALAAVIMLKFVRLLFRVPYGEMLSFSELVFALMLALALPCILLGVQFSLASRKLGPSANASAIVYVFESAGSVVASLVATFILVHYFENFVALLLVALMTQLVVLFADKTSRTRASVFAFVLLIGLPFSPGINTRLYQSYWKSVDNNFELGAHIFSKYGRSTIIQIEGQPVLYYNGVKQSPIPDLPSAQIQAALVLSQLEERGTLLLLGSGANGLYKELAASGHRIITLDTDEKSFHLIDSFMSSEADRPSGDAVIEHHFGDARSFLNMQPDNSFDCIVLNQGPPSSALVNRFYTLEFFELVRSRLRHDGLFVILNFPAAENFIGPELAGLNKTLLNTLNAVFRYTLALPGERAVYFSGNRDAPTRDLALLKSRVENMANRARYFHPDMLDYYYDSFRIEQFRAALESASLNQINSDSKPICYLYDFLYWNKIFRTTPLFYDVLLKLKKGPIVLVVIFLLVLWAIRCLFRKKNNKSAIITGLTLIIGVCAITLNILLILIFQNAFGYIYEWIGLALAAFMGGMTGFAWAANRLSAQNPIRYLRAASGLLILTLLLFPALVSVIRSQQSLVLFFLLSMWCGGITGGAFPMLNRIYIDQHLRANVGAIYAWDLAGGALGSFLVSGLLVPLFGFEFPNYICILMLVFGLLLLFNKRF